MNGLMNRRHQPFRLPQQLMLRVVEGSEMAWAETLVLTALVPAVNFILGSKDPFLLMGEFPWLALIPMLVGIRHGTACGVSSALLLILGTTAGWQLGFFQLEDFPEAFCSALLLTGLITGESRAEWRRRLEQAVTSEQYHRARLEQFAKLYHLLKSSHDRLEHQIKGNTHSLRSALADLHKHFFSLEPKKGEPFAGAAHTILQLFADYGLLQIAALYELDGSGTVQVQPSACLGKPRPITVSDPLFREALRSKHTVALSPSMETKNSTLLAVIPVVDVQGKIWGVVAVHDMPFIALHSENLNLLSILGGYIGDSLMRWSGMGDTESDEWSSFHEQISRSIFDIRCSQVSAMLLGLSVPTSWYESGFIDKFILDSRSMDRICIRKNSNGGLTILKLMPMTDVVGAKQYLSRLDRLLKTYLAIPLSSKGIGYKLDMVDGRYNAQNLIQRFEKLFGPWNLRALKPLPVNSAKPKERQQSWAD